MENNLESYAIQILPHESSECHLWWGCLRAKASNRWHPLAPDAAPHPWRNNISHWNSKVSVWAVHALCCKNNLETGLESVRCPFHNAYIIWHLDAPVLHSKDISSCAWLSVPPWHLVPLLWQTSQSVRATHQRKNRLLGVLCARQWPTQQGRKPWHIKLTQSYNTIDLTRDCCV